MSLMLTFMENDEFEDFLAECVSELPDHLYKAFYGRYEILIDESALTHKMNEIMERGNVYYKRTRQQS